MRAGAPTWWEARLEPAPPGDTPRVASISMRRTRARQAARLVLTSDWHIDSPWCDLDACGRVLALAERLDAAVVVVGDLFDAMARPSDRRYAQSLLTGDTAGVEDYHGALVDRAVRVLGPHARRIALLTAGNHEVAALRRDGCDLLQRTAEALRAATGHAPVVMGYSGWLLLRLVRPGTAATRVVPVWLHHGSSGGGQSVGILEQQRMRQYVPDAAIIACGHTHDLQCVAVQRMRLHEGRGRWTVDEDLQWLVRCGGMQRDRTRGPAFSHADLRAITPKPRGCIVVEAEIMRTTTRDALRLEVRAETV